MPPAIWKNPTPLPPLLAAVPFGQEDHRFDAALDGRGFQFAFDDVRREDVAHRAVFPSRNDDRNVLFAGGQHPTVLRVDFVVLLQYAAAQQLVHEFVRQVAFAFVVGIFPYLEDMLLQAAERFLFRDAGIRHAVHVVFEQFPFVLRRQVAGSAARVCSASGRRGS